jgi:Cache 3/Cache 2 fusion domain
MRLHQWVSARLGTGIVLAVVLAFSAPLIALGDDDGSSGAAVQTQGRIEASIFSYDGKDFVRTNTTLVTEEGKSAVNTKLEHDTPAYKALIQKHSYVGDATVFGRKYAADYAPLTSGDGKLTGALFVGVAK